MLIDLSDIIKDYGGKLKISEGFNMGDIDFMGESFTFLEDCRLDGFIMNNTKSLELCLTVTGKAEVHCARCRKPVTIDVKFPVNEVLVREDGEISEDEDVIVYSGHEIEIDDVLINSFLMNVSGKYLCSDDCKGLCPHCGTDLNLSECDCDKEYIDPRWEKLAEIMKNMSDTE